MTRRWWSRPAARAGLGLTATLAIAAGGAVVATQAEAGPNGHLKYPAGATATRFSGQAFDVCAAPSLSTMRAWLSSPFRAIGVYISGDLRACSQPNLTPSWVREVSAMGWKLIPIDVGRQAPCTTFSKRISTNGSTAREQGEAAARTAIRSARTLGMLPGSALYSDIENYNSRDAQCAGDVHAYLNGWTRALHNGGYLSGIYGNLASAMRTVSTAQQAANRGDAPVDPLRPDMLWNAEWDSQQNLTRWAGVDAYTWAAHQRMKQYRGDHRETHGGVTLTIDSNIADAAVATVAYSVPTPSGAEFAARAELSAAAATRSLGGATVDLVCRADDSMPLQGSWVQTSSGVWLPESIFTGTGTGAETLQSRLGTCLTPYQVQPGRTPIRVGAADTASSPGSLAGGTLVWVICEQPGTTGGRAGQWLRLETGHWVDGWHLRRANQDADSPAIPRCVP